MAWVILVAMLPQLVLAGARQGQFCLTDEHVRVDCHEDASPCAEDEREPVEGDCVDVDTSGSPARTERAPSAPSDLPAVPIVVVPVFLVSDATPERFAHVPDDLPPPFCARAHCCSIVIRC